MSIILDPIVIGEYIYNISGNYFNNNESGQEDVQARNRGKPDIKLAYDNSLR